MVSVLVAVVVAVPRPAVGGCEFVHFDRMPPDAAALWSTNLPLIQTTNLTFQETWQCLESLSRRTDPSGRGITIVDMGLGRPDIRFSLKRTNCSLASAVVECSTHLDGTMLGSQVCLIGRIGVIGLGDDRFVSRALLIEPCDATTKQAITNAHIKSATYGVFDLDQIPFQSGKLKALLWRFKAMIPLVKGLETRTTLVDDDTWEKTVRFEVRAPGYASKTLEAKVFADFGNGEFMEAELTPLPVGHAPTLDEFLPLLRARAATARSESAAELKAAADRGDAKAQFDLGGRCIDGDGVLRDPAEAAKWFRKAAEGFRKAADEGSAVAQFSLGVCYREGQGVPKDDAEAVKWFRKAADQGYADAQVRIGVCYDMGAGVLKDDTEAVKWYRKAADQGSAKAQFNLGLSYDNGTGVPKDHAEAVKLYRSAAEQGEGRAYARLMLGGVALDYAEAVKWYRMFADQGRDSAQYNLGCAYAKGEGVAKDPQAAYGWLLLAATAGRNRDAEDRCEQLEAALSPAQVREARNWALQWKPETTQAVPPTK